MHKVMTFLFKMHHEAPLILFQNNIIVSRTLSASVPKFQAFFKDLAEWQNIIFSIPREQRGKGWENVSFEPLYGIHNNPVLLFCTVTQKNT